jgi:hypothetical protein
MSALMELATLTCDCVAISATNSPTRAGAILSRRLKGRVQAVDRHGPERDPMVQVINSPHSRAAFHALEHAGCL